MDRYLGFGIFLINQKLIFLLFLKSGVSISEQIQKHLTTHPPLGSKNLRPWENSCSHIFRSHPPPS